MASLTLIPVGVERMARHALHLCVSIPLSVFKGKEKRRKIQVGTMTSLPLYRDESRSGLKTESRITKRHNEVGAGKHDGCAKERRWMHEAGKQADRRAGWDKAMLPEKGSYACDTGCLNRKSEGKEKKFARNDDFLVANSVGEDCSGLDTIRCCDIVNARDISAALCEYLLSVDSNWNDAILCVVSGNEAVGVDLKTESGRAITKLVMSASIRLRGRCKRTPMARKRPDSVSILFKCGGSASAIQ